MDTAPEAPETAGNPETATEVAPDVENAPEGVSAPTEGASETDTDPSGKGKVAREAARYRTQLRETQTQLDAANAMVDSLRNEIARNLAKDFGLVRGDELTVPVSELLDAESGLVDAGKVQRAVQALVEEKPYLAGNRGSEAWRSGRPLSDAQAEAMAGTSWSDFLRM